MTVKVGIACSGGGLRSACFSLGVLSELWQKGVFEEPVTLSGVSGGNYATIAFVTTAAHSDLRPPNHENPPTTPAEPGLWSIESPEMRALRTECDAIATSITERAWLLLLALRSMLINLVPASFLALAAGHAAGLIAANLSRLSLPASISVLLGPLLLPLLLAVLAVALAGTRYQSLSHRASSEGVKRYSLLLIAAGITLSCIEALSHAFDALHRLSPSSSSSSAERMGPFPTSGSFSAFLLLGSLLVAICALAGVGWAFPRPWRRHLRTVMAVVGAGIIVGAPFLWAFDGARRSTIFPIGMAIMADLVAVVALTLLFDANSYSMFPIYRARLRSALFWRRTDAGVAGTVVDGSTDLSRLTLSALHDLVSTHASPCRALHPDTRIISCSAVGLSDRSSRDGRAYDSFTFGEQCGSDATGWVDGIEYEGVALPSGGALDLASLMAISGAAVSPTMGRFSRKGYGMLLALLNLRFGVWLNSPRVLLGTAPQRGRLASLPGKIFRRPSVFHVFFEAISSVSGSRRRVFVSDGGHFENLGLVELLGSDCDVAISIDASLEATGQLSALYYALYVLRSKGYEYCFDDEVEFGDGDDFRPSPVLKGWIWRPTGERVRFLHLRSDLYSNMSPELREFANKNSHFPRHPTLFQFLSADVVDAYHLLGRDVARVADVRNMLGR